jgi:NAD(P)H-dependent FMN reductase
MDESLEIPDAAYDAAYRAAVIDPSIYSTAPLDAGLNAAAPLIVAAKLRQILSEPQANEWPGFVHLALNDIADRLDPEWTVQ